MKLQSSGLLLFRRRAAGLEVLLVHPGGPFWSRKDLSKVLTQPVRIMVFAAASFAALRLEQLVGLDGDWIGSRSRLTPRELAVLRLVAAGAQSSEAAQALGLGEETVRSHLKKAQIKLGARNRTQAVAEALRQNLIP